jgi:ribokinase
MSENANHLINLRHRTQPTIDDVARAAGVSKGTVSHVIGGRVPVAAATRARVDQAIAALNYRPADTARALTARKRPAESHMRIDASVPRLTTVGYVSVDYTACLDRLPLREERRLADEIIKSIGGPAANVAAIAAGLGQPFPVVASIITAIGLDQDSDWAAAELSRRRVDLIIPRERRSGRLNRALVLVEASGRRTIVTEPSLLDAVDVQHFVATTDPATTRWWLHLEGYQVPS